MLLNFIKNIIKTILNYLYEILDIVQIPTKKQKILNRNTHIYIYWFYVVKFYSLIHLNIINAKLRSQRNTDKEIEKMKTEIQKIILLLSWTVYLEKKIMLSNIICFLF